MATTTNYGWTTPDDTALVKDGASAIRTLGSSVDTTVKNLNPETTLGDISYRSSTANTNTRLAIGTTGQVLTVSGGVPSWANVSSDSLTLLTTLTLTGASVTYSSVPQTYKYLKIIVHNFLPATDTRILNIRLNGNSANYYNMTPGNTDDFTANQDSILIGSNSDNAVDTKNFIIADIWDYANTTTGKLVTSTSVSHNATTTTNFNVQDKLGWFDTTSAITEILFRSTLGNMTSGTAYIYGVK